MHQPGDHDYDGDDIVSDSDDGLSESLHASGYEDDDQEMSSVSLRAESIDDATQGLYEGVSIESISVPEEPQSLDEQGQDLYEGVSIESIPAPPESPSLDDGHQHPSRGFDPFDYTSDQPMPEPDRRSVRDMKSMKRYCEEDLGDKWYGEKQPGKHCYVPQRYKDRYDEARDGYCCEEPEEDDDDGLEGGESENVFGVCFNDDGIDYYTRERIKPSDLVRLWTEDDPLNVRAHRPDRFKGEDGVHWQDKALCYSRSGLREFIRSSEATDTEHMLAMGVSEWQDGHEDNAVKIFGEFIPSACHDPYPSWAGDEQRAFADTGHGFALDKTSGAYRFFMLADGTFVDLKTKHLLERGDGDIWLRRLAPPGKKIRVGTTKKHGTYGTGMVHGQGNEYNTDGGVAYAPVDPEFPNGRSGDGNDGEPFRTLDEHGRFSRPFRQRETFGPERLSGWGEAVDDDQKNRRDSSEHHEEAGKHNFSMKFTFNEEGCIAFVVMNPVGDEAKTHGYHPLAGGLHTPLCFRHTTDDELYGGFVDNVGDYVYQVGDFNGILFGFHTNDKGSATLGETTSVNGKYIGYKNGFDGLSKEDWKLSNFFFMVSSDLVYMWFSPSYDKLKRTRRVLEEKYDVHDMIIEEMYGHRLQSGCLPTWSIPISYENFLGRSLVECTVGGLSLASFDTDRLAEVLMDNVLHHLSLSTRWHPIQAITFFVCINQAGMNKNNRFDVPVRIQVSALKGVDHHDRQQTEHLKQQLRNAVTSEQSTLMRNMILEKDRHAPYARVTFRNINAMRRVWRKSKRDWEWVANEHGRSTHVESHQPYDGVFANIAHPIENHPRLFLDPIRSEVVEGSIPRVNVSTEPFHGSNKYTTLIGSRVGVIDVFFFGPHIFDVWGPLMRAGGLPVMMTPFMVPPPKNGATTSLFGDPMAYHEKREVSLPKVFIVTCVPSIIHPSVFVAHGELEKVKQYLEEHVKCASYAINGVDEKGHMFFPDQLGLDECASLMLWHHYIETNNYPRFNYTDIKSSLIDRSGLNTRVHLMDYHYEYRELIKGLYVSPESEG